MSEFKAARDALVRTMRRVFPDAKPVPRWAGVEAWGAPRPEAVIDHGAPGTYDPKVTVIGIADRKRGPVVYFLDPGDFHALGTHKALLEGAGFKLGRGCIMHTRKGPLPTDALEEMFRLVKARDARAAAKKGAAPRRAVAEGAAADVDSYLARLPEAQRAALLRLRRQVLAAAPRATERISYGMPTFVHEGALVHMAAFRDHCSFFPGSSGVTAALKADLRRHETGKGTIRFTPDKPLPAALVKKIVRMRVAENEAIAAARHAKKAAATRGATGRVARAASSGGASKEGAPRKKPASRG